jgi:hypothetical protein
MPREARIVRGISYQPIGIVVIRGVCGVWWRVHQVELLFFAAPLMTENEL